MALKTNPKLTNEICSPRKLIPDAKSKHSTRGRTRTDKSARTISNPINKSSSFDFMDSKLEKKLMIDYHHWGRNKMILDIFNKGDKNPKTPLVVEKRQKYYKTR